MSEASGESENRCGRSWTEARLGEVRLHGFWRSLATFRVRVALTMKGIPFSECEVDLVAGEHFAPAHARLNPQPAVPVLEIDGRVIAQSLAILEYLEETRPQPSLLPSDPGARARARALTLVTIADAHPLVVPRVRRYLADEIGLDHAGVDRWARHWLQLGLNTFEAALADTPAAPFAVGATATIADIAIASHCLGAEMFGLDISAYPNVAGLVERLKQSRAFAASYRKPP
jgi:maleylacetoacetate isomerase